MTNPTTYGERCFSKIQYGKELKTAHGTPVAATKILLGDIFPVATDRKIQFPEDALGVRMKSMREIVYQYLAQGTLKASNGYFQMLPLLFSCGMKGDVTAVETTPAQSDYLWTFTPGLAATNTPDSLTIEYGDNVQAFRSEYAMFQRLKFTGAIAQGQGDSPVAIEGEWFARQLAKNAFTGALSLPVVEPMNAKTARLYVDTTWAGVGATEQANSLRKFDVEILTGVHPKFLGAADKFFTIHGEGDFEFKAILDLEGTDLASAIRDAKDAGTLAVVRLTVTGAQIGTGTPHKLTLDLGGFWEDVKPLASEDRGSNITQAVLHGTYDPTGAKGLQCTVTTNSATM
jgi:hypothetical protein